MSKNIWTPLQMSEFGYFNMHPILTQLLWSTQSIEYPYNSIFNIISSVRGFKAPQNWAIDQWNCVLWTEMLGSTIKFYEN